MQVHKSCPLTIDQLGNAITASLVGQVHEIAPPLLLALMIERFPDVIRGEVEAFLANLGAREEVREAG